MNERDLAFTPALDQAAMLRSGEITSVELTECYLARIDELNPQLNAYVTVAADFAREHAHAADALLRDGKDDDSLPPFLGVPISIKDLHDTAGIRTTHGTAAWHDRVPEHDDEVVARCKRGGFVFLGKTIVPEFGPLNISEPPGYPPGRNPWDPNRSCGGSSGGAAAALVAGLCAVSHGSDGGGSIRNPSAWCGAVGIKPQRGRVSAAPDSQQFFSINGPIARSVADAAALLDVMAGPATGDAWWAPPFARPLLEEVVRPPDRLRIAFHPHPGVDRDACAPANRQAVDDTARLLESLGHAVEEAVPPGYAEDLVVQSSTIFAANHAAAAAMVPYPPLDTLDPWMRTLVEMGRLVNAVDYVKSLDELQAMSRRTVAFFDDGGYDLFVAPTVAAPPPMVGSMSNVGIERVMEFWALTPFTALWNTTGQPAMSLPLAMDEAGLPVGVQLVGRPADEALLVRVAAVLEAERPWIDRRPPIS
jgi:amidase